VLFVFKIFKIAAISKWPQLNPHFSVSMATAAKFVTPIPIILAYLIPLDVDVVPNKFHQFLFGE
jgi:hypothetical protein